MKVRTDITFQIMETAARITILIYFVFSYNDAIYRHGFFNRVDFHNHTNTPFLLGKMQNVTSVVTCGLYCLGHVTCESYSLKFSESVCSLYNGNYHALGIHYVDVAVFYSKKGCDITGFLYEEPLKLCYHISNNAASHIVARGFCESYGGHLILIQSDDMQAFIVSQLPSSGIFWIDGERIASNIDRWLDFNGQEMNYFHWFGWEPGHTEKYIEIYDNSNSGTYWGWNDKNDTASSRFICQIDV